RVKRRTYFWIDFETTGVFDILSEIPVFPIDVGIIITDDDYNIYETYEYMISWKELHKKINTFNDRIQWPDEFKDAYQYHKIEANDYLDKSVDVNIVGEDIYALAKKYTFKNAITNPVLISDNIQFEYRLMEETLKPYCRTENLKWPFHYCGYDTSEFLIRTGIGDPKNVEHNPLRDASTLLTHMVRARQYINKDVETW
ncbi:MAG: hypothetical protein ACOCQD_03495, partial [archaeon]